MRKQIGILLLMSLFLAACASVAQTVTTTEAPDPTATVAPTATREPTAPPTPEPTATSEPEVAEAVEATPTTSRDEIPPRDAIFEFETNFILHSVPYSEILSGGPPRDGIPAIDDPQFVTVREADDWLEPVEPVVFVQIDDDARAYPIQVFIWHEIVNDVVAELPLVVTFCPLCNTAIAFERTVDGKVLDFGTTGRLRYSNLIMYDRQTESWWQQATGEAIIGDLTGTQLVFRPASIISWEDFKTNYPDGMVLSRDTGYNAPYGQNPYAGYDDVRRSPFAYSGPETPGTLPAMAYVMTVEIGEEAVAYPYRELNDVFVVNDQVGGKELVVFWQEGTASALDETIIAGGRDIGSANAYLRELDGQTLTFKYEDGRILDEQTGSEWDVLGQAVAGELAGAQLTPVIAINHFWFSWAAFKPETRVYEAN